MRTVKTHKLFLIYGLLMFLALTSADCKLGRIFKLPFAYSVNFVYSPIIRTWIKNLISTYYSTLYNEVHMNIIQPIKMNKPK